MKPLDLSLSLIIPVYNASFFIKSSINKLKDWVKLQKFDLEIIFVNDGSSDDTEAIIGLKIENDSRFSLISYQKNRGKGYAVKQGMLKSKGEFKVFTDADIPYGLSVVNDIMDYLSKNEYQVCIGNRLDKNSDYHVDMTFLRKLSSQLFTFFVTRFTINDVGDTQCGLKGYTSEVADRIFKKTKISGFAFDVESVYLCYKYGIEIKRIAVQFEGNTISTINLFTSSIQMFFDVLSLPIRYHVLKQY